MVQILFALLAGILTIAAPCILLPLPIILGASVGHQNKTRPLFLVFGFILSFSLLALLINFLVTALNLNPNILRSIAVILLALFAVFMIWPRPFEIFMSRFSTLLGRANQTGERAGAGNFGGFILGILIGIIWAPCAGPILGAILTLIALQNNFSQAALLLVAYAIGAGLPMLAIAYGGQALTTKIKSIAQYSRRLQQVFGVILIILALAIYFQYDTLIQTKLLASVPSLNIGLENNLMNNFITRPKLSAQKKAPDFVGINTWLNSEPLTLADLKGKVVLVDFWTYSCINCVRTLPYVTSWYDKYKDSGLVVVGIHSPEFAFEKETANVKMAIKQYKINYPVAQDNNLSTWQAYDNQYWPAEYLIDQSGNIVYTHFGEGEYDKTENAIRELLGVAGGVAANNGQDLSQVKSPEMYFGGNRLEYLTAKQEPSIVPIEYSLPANLGLNQFALGGKWEFAADKATLVGNSGKIKLHFYAAKVFMVAQSLSQPVTLSIVVDGVAQPEVVVNQSELYTLFDSLKYADHTIEIDIPQSGLDAFTFTFG
ncbi:MAG: cytochrome c biogenesis protein DipZ [Patescibacteria group bacterium]